MVYKFILFSEVEKQGQGQDLWILLNQCPTLEEKDFCGKMKLMAGLFCNDNQG